jgi:amino acid permease
MDSKINQNLKNLNSLNKERIFWLRISLFVVVLSVITIFNWNYLIKTDLIFLVVSIGIIITIIWWYWTMSIIRKLIGFKTVETEIMNDLILDIRDIKQDIRKNLSNNS